MAAGRKIKGITLEIGGDTSGLQKALGDINGKIKSTQAQLKDVNSLLKLDPSNVVLVTQKQELLKDAIADTTEKLDNLEAAQKDVTAALEAGKIGQEQYRAFQREVEETRTTLKRYETELDGLNTNQDRLAVNTERLNKLFDATGSNVDDYADVLGSRLVTAIKNGSASADQLKLALEKISKSAIDGKADIKQITAALDTVDDGQAINNLIRELKEAGTQADNTSEKMDKIGKSLTGGALVEAAEQISAVGDKIVVLGEKSMDAFTEMQDATVKASTYFGETGDAAEQTAGIIKDVYSEGVGDSLDAVSNAVITVKKNLDNLNETDMTHLTEQAITLDELYGIDMNETLRGVNSLMQQYGMSAQEAMDYIVRGTQNGLDKTNELGDNLSEYSGKFEQAGYSAQEYFQLLQNGLEGGAYNLDKVNDAINEVTTRIADGTIADSMSKINEKTGDLEEGTGGWGAEVEEVFRQWQQGGATQKQVIDAIVSDIQNTENQQDKLNKAALAFGTMAEDGNVKFIESLTSVGSAYDNVTGTAQNMFDSSTTESQKFEASMRQLEQSIIPLGETVIRLANEILPPLVEVVKRVVDFFQNLPEPVQNFILILGALIAAFTALAPVISAVAMIVGTLGTAALGPVIGIIVGVAAAITGIIALVKNWGTVTEWFGDLWQTVKEKCTAIWESICVFFTERIPAAWDSVVAKFQGIPEWWAGIWQQVQEFFINIWNSIMENPIISGIVTTIQALWENCVSTLQGIWNGLKDIAMGVWELIKNSVLGPVLVLIDLVTGDFEKLGTDAKQIWENMRDAAGTIWDGIKTVIFNLVNGMITNVTTIANGFQDTIENIWESIKTAAMEKWESIKQYVVDKAKNLKEQAIDAFKNMLSGIKSTLSNLGDIVENGFQSAIRFITSLPSKALQWGSDFINGIAEGITNAIGNVTTAVSNVADRIRSFLHFSVPDEGPLTEYESWMPDFMEGLAKGIEKSKSVVTNALTGLSRDMTVNANAMLENSGGIQNTAIANITSILSRYLPYLENGTTLIWETGEVAAVLAPSMNKQLGILAKEEEYL